MAKTDDTPDLSWIQPKARVRAPRHGTGTVVAVENNYVAIRWDHKPVSSPALNHSWSFVAKLTTA